jgi:hypothetical protein
MDDLERLYRRLVLSVRDGAPHLLGRQFRLGDVAAHLVPYRHTRRELGFESIQQYEAALLRLASGERGYLLADAMLQDAARRALAGPQPDGTLLQSHAESPVALPPHALALAGLEAPGEPGHATAVAPPPVRRTTAETGSVPAAADLERAVAASSRATEAWAEPPRPSAPPREAPQPMSSPVSAHHSVTAGGHPCRYCGQPLPEGRQVTFCPYCGNNVTVLQCPACSTELEVGWRFCITCGRAMDDAAFGAPGGSPGDAGTPGSTPPAGAR